MGFMMKNLLKVILNKLVLIIVPFIFTGCFLSGDSSEDIRADRGKSGLIPVADAYGKK
jgi:hypothetical protein